MSVCVCPAPQVRARLPLGSNLSHYVTWVTKLQAATEQRRQAALADRMERELEQCTFQPTTTHMPGSSRHSRRSSGGYGSQGFGSQADSLSYAMGEGGVGGVWEEAGGSDGVGGWGDVAGWGEVAGWDGLQRLADQLSRSS